MSPRYQGMAAERADTLSPKRADTGTGVTLVNVSAPAKARNSAAMRVNTASS